VSDIWAKAILLNKELIPLYYKMLKNDHVMIRHSAYCLTQEGVDILANYFFEEEGLDAFPVLQSEQSSSLLKQDKKRVILIPESYTQYFGITYI
jgi:hypothetical protein